MNLLISIATLDLKIIDVIPPLRLDYLNSFFLVLTKLGSWEAILTLTILLGIIFWVIQKRSLIFPLLISVLGSGLMVTAVKYIVDRPRPVTDLALSLETGPSYPSAHAALTLALLGFLIYIIWRFFPKWNLVWRIILTVIFFFPILLIGFSRLYLGVHYLSDVVAGYLVGLLWLLIGMYMSRIRRS